MKFTKRWIRDKKKVVAAPSEQVTALRERAATIDFGCRFVGSKCLTQIAGPGRIFNKFNCCSLCHGAKGFLSAIYQSHSEVYDKEWRWKTGFWRPKTGCSLPVDLRSFTCLAFYCGKHQGANKELFDQLKQMLKEEEA